MRCDTAAATAETQLSPPPLIVPSGDDGEWANNEAISAVLLLLVEPPPFRGRPIRAHTHSQLPNISAA